MLNITRLNPTKSRIEMDCSINGRTFLLWVDTGSPNTLVHSNMADALKIPTVKGMTSSGKVAGKEFQKRPAITLPSLVIPNCQPLRNIRAIAALDGDEWKDIVILGLNALNHLVYKIDRSRTALLNGWKH